MACTSYCIKNFPNFNFATRACYPTGREIFTNDMQISENFHMAKISAYTVLLISIMTDKGCDQNPAITFSGTRKHIMWATVTNSFFLMFFVHVSTYVSYCYKSLFLMFFVPQVCTNMRTYTYFQSLHA